MTRRGFLVSSTAMAMPTSSLASNVVAAVVDHVAPSGTDEARLIALHDYLRDTVKFGWTSTFNAEGPAETLAAGIGFCQTKSVLMRDLLLASGIEARLVFAEIDANVIFGLIDPGTPMVDHAFVEAKLNDQWIPFDSHVVDMPLFRAAVSRCLNEKLRLGYDVHASGVAEFPGFSQFVDDGQTRGRTWGAYESIQDFLNSDTAAWNRIPFLARLLAGFALRSANNRADRLRAARE